MAAADRRLILDQVRRIAAVPAEAAPEGAIFYCARVLEGASAAAVAKLGLEPAKVVISNLAVIEAHRLMDTVTKEFAHSLRRMGNDVRHKLEDSSLTDVRLAVVLVRAVVEWFAAIDPGEEEERALRTLNGLIDADAPEVAVTRLLSRLEQNDEADINALLALRPAIEKSRFLASLAADALIGCGRAASAGEILAACKERFGADPRHQQLAALVLSRTGQLEEAEKAARKLLEKYADDDETAGICGGIFKRRWDKDSQQAGALRQAHKLYLAQWDKGKKANAYLGLNAAATALYLGEADKAAQIGRETSAKMDERDARLSKAGLAARDGGRAAYYDDATRAELALLASDAAQASALYQAAFARYPGFAGDIAGTKAQAARVAERLNLSGLAL